MLKGNYIVIFGVDKILSPCPPGGGKKSKTQRREGKQKEKKRGKKKGGRGNGREGKEGKWIGREGV